MSPTGTPSPHTPSSAQDAPFTALPLRRAASDGAGLVLSLSTSGAIVVPIRCHGGGWDCIVVADPTGPYRPGETIRCSTLDIQTALPVEFGDPALALAGDEYAAVWLARIVGHTGGGHVYQLARVLVGHVRDPGSRLLTIDEPVRRFLLHTVHLMPPGLDRLIDRLTRDGFLAPVHDADPHSYRMTLPAIATPPRTREETP